MGFLTYLKKNRIKILKTLIAIAVIYFIVSALLHMISGLFNDIYNTITLTYLLILVLCNLIVEFSPYLLNNYLIFVFPFLSNYSGRGPVYILIGFATISPELSFLLNIGGYVLIIIGLSCLYMHWLIVKNFKLEYQDFEVMKNNYQDFNDDMQRDSLSFPKFITNYENISTNNSINYNNINNIEGKKNPIEEKNNLENNDNKFTNSKNIFSNTLNNQNEMNEL